MARISLRIVVLLAMLLSGLVTAHADEATIRERLSHPHREGELIVRYRDGRVGTPRDADRFHGRHGTRSLKRFRGEHLEHLALEKGRELAAAMGELERDPDVAYVEPNYLVQALAVPATPDDPKFPLLWGMTKISAPEAWGVTTGSSGVVIAVLDSGIDYTHPDLAANIWPGIGYNALTGSTDPLDDHGHGTHVAGIIGAVGNNAVGVTGVNWTTRIVSCKFIDATGKGSVADAITCLEQIRTLKDQGVNIVATNNSWGGDAYSQALHDAIAAQRDILFITAAGNNGTNNDIKPTYPAGYDHPLVLAVAATTSVDALASYSDYGRRTVHTGAPGHSILSTTRGGGYGLMSGTSTASPHVAGLAGLVSSGRPDLDWRGIRNTLLSTGDPVAELSGKSITGRRINVYQAVTCTDSSFFSALSFPRNPVVGTPAILSALSINCANPVGPVTIGLSSGTVTLADDGVSPDLVAGDGIFTGSYVPERTTETFLFSSSAGSETIMVPIPAPLLMDAVSFPRGTVGVSYSASLTATGGTLPYRWSLIGGYLPAGLSLNTATGVISGTPLVDETRYFSLKVTDDAGMTDAQTFSVTIAPPLIMTTSSLPAATVGVPYSQTLTATGGTPPYTWLTLGVPPPDGLNLSANGILSGTPTAIGSTTMTVAVVDSTYTSVISYLTLTVDPAVLTIKTSDLAVGMVGQPYSQTLVATGGTLPYTWAIDSGSLPAGLNLAGDGTLSGIPTVEETTTFTVRVKDAAGATLTATLSIIIKPAAASNVALAANGGIAVASTAGASYAAAMVNDGNRAPASGYWRDTTYNTWPDSVMVSFNGPKIISEIDVITAQTSLTSAIEPIVGLTTFTANGITAYDVQYCKDLSAGYTTTCPVSGTGTMWEKVGTVTAADPKLVWRTISFPAVTTNRIRVVVTAALQGNSRIVEIEAYTPPPTTNMPPTVTLTSPVSGATFTAPADITLTAIAADSDGSVAKVDFYSGATLLHSATSDTYSYTWTGVPAGSYTLTAVATDNAGATTTSAAATVTVNPAAKQTPTITSWPTASAITYGQTLAASMLNGGSASTGGSFAWTTPSIAPAAGTPSYSVTFTPDDSATYTTVTGSVSITVNPASQTIGTITLSPATLSVGGSGTVTAIATSGLAVSFSSTTTSICSVSGSTVTGVATGICTITANQAGNANYSAAPQVTQDFSVSSGTVTAINVALAANGGVATASTAGVGYSAANVNNGNRTPAGGYWRDTTYNSYPDWVQVAFNGAKTISEIAVITAQTSLTSTTEPTAGMTFTYNGITSFDVQYCPAGTNCTAAVPGTGWVNVKSYAGNNKVLNSITFDPVNASKVRVVVNAALQGNSRIVEIEVYTTAASANQPPTVTLDTPANGATVTAPADITLTATAADSDGSVAKVDFYNGATLLYSATSTPYSYTWTGVPAGSYTLTAVATDNTGATTTSTAAKVTVNPAAKQTPTITSWPTASSITYGQTLAASILNGGSASTGGRFTWTTPSTAPAAGTPSYSVTFTPDDSATYTTVIGLVSITVNPASQTIGTITLSPATLSVGGSGTVTAIATSGLAVSFTSTTTSICSVSGSTVTGVAAGICTIAANQAGNVNYSAAPQVTQDFTVSSGTVTSINVALAANGGVATASSASTGGSYPTVAVNNGNRTPAGGYWRDATYNAYPDWVQVAFNGTKMISEIDVITAQTSLTSVTEPASGMTFTANGITAFDVQYCPAGATCTAAIPGTGWVNVKSYTGNNKVLNNETFGSVSASKVRVVVNAALQGNSRIVELEAYGN